MKKKLFRDLKPGQKFRYKRRLYLVDSVYCPVHIISGEVSQFAHDTIVTPVKLFIRVK